jgi:arylsulfatase A-like enzyme
MLEFLQSRPWWSRTVLVVTADHGEMFPSDRREIRVHGFDGRLRTYGHGFTFYEEITHVPLVIRPPSGLPEERSLDAPASLIDLRATLSDLMGLGLPPIGHPWFSLAPWLSPIPPPTAPERRAWSYMASNLLGPAQEAIRSDHLKLIVYPNGERPSELYDLTVDPQERADQSRGEPDGMASAMAQLEWIRAALKTPEQTAIAPISESTWERLKAIGYAR